MPSGLTDTRSEDSDGMSSNEVIEMAPPRDRLDASEQPAAAAAAAGSGDESVGLCVVNVEQEMTFDVRRSSSSALSKDTDGEQQKQLETSSAAADDTANEQQQQQLQQPMDRHQLRPYDGDSSTTFRPINTTIKNNNTSAAETNDHQRSPGGAQEPPAPSAAVKPHGTSVGCKDKMAKKEEDGEDEEEEETALLLKDGPKRKEESLKFPRKSLPLLPRIDQYERHPLLQMRSKTGITEFEMLMIEKELLKRRQSMDSDRASPHSSSSAAASAAAANRRKTGGSLRQQPAMTPALLLIPRIAQYEPHPLLKKSADGVYELERILQEKQLQRQQQQQQQQQQHRRQQTSSHQMTHSTHPEQSTASSSRHPSQITGARRTEIDYCPRKPTHSRRCQVEEDDDDDDEGREDDGLIGPSVLDHRHFEASAATQEPVSMETEHSQQQQRRVRFQRQKSAPDDCDEGLKIREGEGVEGGEGEGGGEGNAKKGNGSDSVGRNGSSDVTLLKAKGDGHSQTIAASSKDNNRQQEQRKLDNRNNRNNSADRTDGRSCCLS